MEKVVWKKKQVVMVVVVGCQYELWFVFVGFQIFVWVQEFKVVFFFCGLGRKFGFRFFWILLIFQCEGKQVVGVREKGYIEKSGEFKLIIVKTMDLECIKVKIVLQFGIKRNLGFKFYLWLINFGLISGFFIDFDLCGFFKL